jgi:hypothetical protein
MAKTISEILRGTERWKRYIEVNERQRKRMQQNKKDNWNKNK